MDWLQAHGAEERRRAIEVAQKLLEADFISDTRALPGSEFRETLDYTFSEYTMVEKRYPLRHIQQLSRKKREKRGKSRERKGRR